MTLPRKERSAIAATAAAVVVLVGLTITQYARTSWPFAPASPVAAVKPVAESPVKPATEPAADPHAGHVMPSAEPAADPHAGHIMPSAEPAADPHAGHIMPSAEPAADPHAGHVMPGTPAPPKADPSALPPGYAAVMIDAAQAKAIGLASAVVEERALTRTVRTVGVVAFDETRTTHVHAKVRGWIEKVQANFIGRAVRAGQALVSIYSQDVYAAEAELVGLLDRGKDDPLVAAARRRLALWDVPKSEIARLEATREPSRTFTLSAPRSGTIVAKAAIEGTFVEPSTELYTLSDLSRLWVLLDLYERDAAYVHVGDRAKLAIEGQGAPLDATIEFLAPTINEATRTLQARFVIDNKDGRLRPGSFVSAELTISMGSGLTIPESAVIRTGTRAIVFLVHGEHIQPREITLGASSGDQYRVEAGLAAGDRVATGAQFLLDSESRLRASSGGGGGHVH